MPFVTTPFIVELRDLEVLPLSRPTPAAGETGAAMLQSNSFTAAITSLTFAEETAPKANDASPSATQRISAHVQDENAAVRVSLLAHVAPNASEPARTHCLTIASHTFARAAATQKATPEGTTAEVYHWCLHSPLVLGSADAVQSLSVGVHSVLPHTKGRKGKAASEAQEEKDNDGGEEEEEEEMTVRTQPYRGTRRFVVRLMGQQLTELTAQQVMLIAGG